MHLDPVQLDQIVLNLAANAGDAMPDGGWLRLSTSRRVVTDGEDPDGLPAGDWVVLAVHDTGPGMTPEVMARVFEPFFTTKDGRGTGLGLATCHAIVTSAGGVIRVRSVLGLGTTLLVALPAASGTAEPLEERRSQAPVGGRERVLLVEDDPMIRKLGATILQRKGYDVLVAVDGLHAMELVADEANPIDLLFSDIVMPRMGGPELASRLLREMPGLRVMLTSGHAEGVAGREDSLPPGVVFLPKPYTADQLLARVRAVLGDPRDGGP